MKTSPKPWSDFSYLWFHWNKKINLRKKKNHEIVFHWKCQFTKPKDFMEMYQLSQICRGKAFLAPEWNFWSKLQENFYQADRSFLTCGFSSRDWESATIADGKSTHRGAGEAFASEAAALQLFTLTPKALPLWKVHYPLSYMGISTFLPLICK